MTDTTGTPGSGSPERFADDARRYRLESRIATGGMGEVWRATDTTLGREVAVKLLKQEFADDPTFRSRFQTEAQHAAALHHPGVAGVYDFGEAMLPGASDGSGTPRPYLVMELVDGEPLSDLLRGGRRIDPEVARDLVAQAADAVAVAHAAGIVHRDIKPANLLITPDRRVKITDFGIARAADGVGITQTGQVMGTPQYFSPEQARGNPATPASDVYSLGVVAFECLAGRRPFEAESPIATALAHLQQPVPELPEDVPADLAAVVRRALAKEPADRYPDAAAFARALRDPATELMAAALPATQATQVLGPAGTAGATAVSPVPPPVDTEDEDQRPRRPWAVVLLVLLLVAAAAVVLLLVTGGDDEPDEEPPPSPTRSSEASTPERTPTRTTPSETQEESPEPPPTSREPSPTPTPRETPSETPPSDTPSETPPSDTPSETPPSDTPSETPTDLPTSPAGSTPTEDPTSPVAGARTQNSEGEPTR